MRKLFLNSTDELPTLYIDMVFAESIRPILFTCVDEESRLYICSCCYASGDKCVWIIASTTLNKVISLLRNECDIWGMFGNNEYVTVVTKCRNSESPAVQSINIKDLPQELLPTKGYDIGAEDGEFDEELRELKSRLDGSCEYDVSLAQDSFYTIVQKIYASIRPNISIIVPESEIEYWENNVQMAFPMGA